MNPDFLTELVERIPGVDAEARHEAQLRQDRLTKPTGALGRLEELSVWVAGVQRRCPPTQFQRPSLVIFAGDHGVVTKAGTSAYPSAVTAQMVLNFAAGGAAANVLARQHGVKLRVADMSVDTDYTEFGGIDPRIVAHKVRRSTGAINVEDAMSYAQSEAAWQAGIDLANEEVDSGADLLIAGDMGIGNTTCSAGLTGLMTGLEPADVVGRGTGVDDVTLMRKTAAVRDAMSRGREHKGDPIALMAAVGGPDLAAMAGFLLGASARATPVLLDGSIIGAAALVAARTSRRATQWWLAGHRSTEPAHTAALERLELEPVLDLGMRLGEGSGALTALPIVQSAAALLGEMATFEEAGVSDREHDE